MGNFFKIKLLLILFLLISLTASIKNNKRDIRINAGIYQVLYSEKLEQPLEVWYAVKCSNGTESRKGMDFYTNDSIHTSSGEDYSNNDWDKGHMAPAGDFSCNKNDLYMTFSYLNCALQHKDLNRNTWRFLEEHERDLSVKNKVKVRIKIFFDKNCTKLKTGATVPSGFKKYISYGKNKEIYFFKNEKPLYDDYTKYMVSK